MAGFYGAPSIGPQMGGGTAAANPQLLALLAALSAGGGGGQQNSAPTLPTPPPAPAGAFIPPSVQANPGPGQAASQTGSALGGLGTMLGGGKDGSADPLGNIKQMFGGGKGPGATGGQLGPGASLMGGSLTGPGYAGG